MKWRCTPRDEDEWSRSLYSNEEATRGKKRWPEIPKQTGTKNLCVQAMYMMIESELTGSPSWCRDHESGKISGNR